MPDLVTVFFAYAVVTHNDATLYVDSSQVNDAVRTHLGKDVAIKSYDAIWEDLKYQGQSLESTKQDVWMHSHQTLSTSSTEHYTGTAIPARK